MLLAEYIRDIGYNPEQVQDFIPTPGSMATAMYYSGYDPRTMEPVYVPRDPHEKAMQRALLQYRNPQNYDLVYEALIRTGRMDLVGHGPNCLIRPTKPKANAKPTRRSNPKNKAVNKTVNKPENKGTNKAADKTANKAVKPEAKASKTTNKPVGRAGAKGQQKNIGKTGGKPAKNSSNLKKNSKKDK